MHLTERDLTVVDFISMYRVATTQMIVTSIYTNYNVGTRRLKKLVDEGYLKRERIYTGEWVYYIGESIDILESLMVTDLVLKLLDKDLRLNSIKYDLEYGYTNVDAQVELTTKEGDDYILFINSSINKSKDLLTKYSELCLYKEIIGENIPIIVLIDNTLISNWDTVGEEINKVQLKRDISNIGDLLDKLGV